MSKQTRLAELSAEIFRRAVELFDGDKMTFDEARRQAAKQVATVAKLKPSKPITTQPAAAIDDDGSSNNDRETFFQRIAGIRERLFNSAGVLDSGQALGASRSGQDVSALSEDPPNPKNAPKATAFGRIARYLPFKEDETEPAPESAPSDSEAATLAGYYSPSLVRDRISDDEFPVGLRDHATDNWRRSLTESQVVKKPTVDIEVNPFDVAEVNAALNRQVRVSK